MSEHFGNMDIILQYSFCQFGRLPRVNIGNTWSPPKIHYKWQIVTRHAVFVFISTNFVGCGCNFAWSSAMQMTFFRILFTNSLRNKLILFYILSEWPCIFSIFQIIYLFSVKKIPFQGIFSSWKLGNLP